MDMSARQEAISAARDLLARFRAAHPAWQDEQMPLEELAGWLDCSVETFHPDDYPAGTYGFLEPGEQLIWLCRTLSPTLRRFTLAHELGHVILHSHISTIHDLPVQAAPPTGSITASDPCQEEDVQEETTGLLVQEQMEHMLGPGLAYDPRSERELAANLFAAELLMPLERIRELYIREQVPFAELAERFAVSQAALLNRLAGLLSAQFPQTPEEAAPAPIDRSSESDNSGRADEQVQTAPKKSYDAFQQAAITASTPALIVAGPGSGKTSTLIGRVEHLLQDEGVDPEHILALTFSRKAASEMQERLERLLPVGAPAPTISTFHAFCARLLRTYGHLLGLRQDFELLDDAQGYFLLYDRADELPLRHYQNLHNPTTHFQSFLKAISRAKDELITPTRYRELALDMLAQAVSAEAVEEAERALEVADIYALYQRAMEQSGNTDFGGLLMLAVQLLTEQDAVRAEIQARYQHILVDEFQDINRASGVLLRLLGGQQQRVWVVGDANQSIYGFRGASPANISQFQQDYPSAAVFPLSRNYRSRPDIVSLADTFRRGILEQNPSLEAVQTAREGEHEAYITLAQASDEVNELRGLARDVRQKLREGYRGRDIVVLCRTRSLVRRVKQTLAEAELQVDLRADFLEQEHVKNLLSLLLLLGEDSGMGILRAARLPAHTVPQADVETLLITARTRQTSVFNLLLYREFPLDLSSEGEQALTRLADILSRLALTSTSVWQVLARYLLAETSLARALLEAGSDVQASTIRQDYARLLQYAHTYDHQRQGAQERSSVESGENGDEPSSRPGIREQIRGFLAYFQVITSLRQEGEGQREASGEESVEELDLVRVMTVHASKGLEFPIVYLPSLTQKRFPLLRRFNVTPPPAGMLAPESEGERAHESGEACLFYVGATRARDQLILSYSDRHGKQSAKRSGYIDALVVGLPDERVRRVAWSNAPLSTSSEAPGEGESVAVSGPSQSFIESMQSSRLRARHIEDYQTCPRRYAYSNIYHFQRNDGSFLPFWQATQEAVRVLTERMLQSDQPASKEELADLFKHHWHAQGGDEQPFARQYEQHGLEIIEQVWDKLRVEEPGSWKMHQTLSVELAGRSIEVTIDRIEAPEDNEQPARLVRTRLGKSKSKPTPETRELLYLEARRQHFPDREITLQTHNLSTGERHDMKITTRKAESLVGDLEEAVAGIERQDYTPRPDPFTCPNCPFYLICPV
jgi:superfamily I DNA/RNA helicase/Zn-dependent peptidase ImmA (M78 family)/CRISPR/Cas system-associated exonuclease Cas4 (RecB family)